jgi:hypothetical protein
MYQELRERGEEEEVPQGYSLYFNRPAGVFSIFQPPRRGILYISTAPQGYSLYFNRTFAYETYYYGIYFYEIYFYGSILLRREYTSP